MAAVTGVDLAASAVRVVSASAVGDDGFVGLHRAAIVPLSAGAIHAGKILQPTVVADALTDALGSAGLRPTGVVLGIGGASTGVEVRAIPTAVKPKERVSFLKGTEPVAGLGWDDVAVSLTAVPGRTLDGQGREVQTFCVAVAALEELAATYEVCRLAKVIPAMVDLSAAATLRALVRLPADATDIATIVDIGATQTVVMTRQGPAIRSLRTVDRGGADITRAIMDVTKGTAEDAEQRKRYLTLPARPGATGPEIASRYTSRTSATSGTTTTVEQALETACSALLAQVVRSVETDAIDHPGRTAGVAVTGGGALLAGLPERLSVLLDNLPVRLGVPWADVDASRKHLAALTYTPAGSDRQVVDSQLLMRMATAVGLTQGRAR